MTDAWIFTDGGKWWLILEADDGTLSPKHGPYESFEDANRARTKLDPGSDWRHRRVPRLLGVL